MPGRISVSLYDETKGQRNVDDKSDNYQILRYPCSSSTQVCTPYVVRLSRGIYKIELFGASGGYPNNDPNLAGRGSYTSGHLTVSQEMTLYVYLGQQGKLNGPRTFNGGGRGSIKAGSSGGSSDIRLVAGEWNKFESLKSRVMVAAGGVGGHKHVGYITGTHGGNLTGFDGILTIDSECFPLEPAVKAFAATQEHGGIGGRNNEYSADDGKFGIGSDPIQIDLSYTSGGSGGYFGGAGSAKANCHVGVGSSGSSFISGHEGCNAILNISTSQDDIHLSNQSLHYSGIRFSSTIIKSGYESYPSPSSSDSSIPRGNIGNGFAVISFLSYNIKTRKIILFSYHFYLLLEITIS